MIKLIAVMLTAAFVTIGASQSARADGPEQGLVVGVETGQTLGAALLYGVNNMVQVGAGLGLQVGDNTFFYLSPQVRFLFALGMANLYFAASAELQLLFGDREATALAIKAALQYYVARAIAIYAGVGFLNVEFDPSNFAIGILQPHVGAQVAFN